MTREAGQHLLHYTPDGKTIVCDRQYGNSDVILIERDVAK